MKHVTKEILKYMLDNNEDMLLVDVRSEESYAKGHLPSAVNIPWRELALEQHEEELGDAHAVVVYCSSTTCDASEKGGKILEAMKHKVVEYDGGYADWSAADYQIES